MSISGITSSSKAALSTYGRYFSTDRVSLSGKSISAAKRLASRSVLLPERKSVFSGIPPIDVLYEAYRVQIHGHIILYVCTADSENY